MSDDVKKRRRERYDVRDDVAQKGGDLMGFRPRDPSLQHSCFGLRDETQSTGLCFCRPSPSQGSNPI